MTNLINDYIKTHTPNNAAGINFQAEEQASPKTEAAPNNTTVNDSLDFLDMYAKMKMNTDISTNGLIIREGKINGRNALIKSVVKNSNSKSYDIMKEGYIGDKKLLLSITGLEDSEKETIKYKGEFNGKDIDLTIEVPKEPDKVKGFMDRIIRHKLYIPEYLSIKGKIGNEPYELMLPNAKVPRDADTKDLVSVILYSECLHPAVIDGEIVAIKPDKNRIKKWKNGIEKQENFLKENVKPLIDQAVATAFGGIIALIGAKFFGKK